MVCSKPQIPPLPVLFAGCWGKVALKRGAGGEAQRKRRSDLSEGRGAKGSQISLIPGMLNANQRVTGRFKRNAGPRTGPQCQRRRDRRKQKLPRTQPAWARGQVTGAGLCGWTDRPATAPASTCCTKEEPREQGPGLEEVSQKLSAPKCSQTGWPPCPEGTSGAFRPCGHCPVQRPSPKVSGIFQLVAMSSGWQHSPRNFILRPLAEPARQPPPSGNAQGTRTSAGEEEGRLEAGGGTSLSFSQCLACSSTRARFLSRRLLGVAASAQCHLPDPLLQPYHLTPMPTDTLLAPCAL